MLSKLRKRPRYRAFRRQDAGLMSDDKPGAHGGFSLRNDGMHLHRPLFRTPGSIVTAKINCQRNRREKP